MFLTLLIFSVSAVIYSMIMTRKICYLSPNVTTDNEKMIWAAHEINLWAWPSKMHDIAYNRSQLREYWTIFLVVVSHLIIRDRSDWGNVVLALAAHAVSTILLFWLASLYLTEMHAFLISMLYASLLWPYYISIYIGHILLSQAFFLGSLVCFVNSSGDYEIPLLILAGALTTISFFSSSASRKYPVLFVLVAGLLLAKEADYILPSGQHFLLLFSISIAISFFGVVVFQKPLTSLIMRILNIRADHHVIVSNLSKQILIVIPIFCAILLYGYLYLPDILSKILLLSTGAIVVLHILLPFKTFMKNLKRSGIWLNVSNWASHFASYPDPLKTFGREIPVDFRGGGWSWLHKLFIRMIPELYSLWLAACLLITIGPIFNFVELKLEMFEIVAVLTLSIVPPVVHYATGGLRVGKALFSVVLPALLPIAIAVDVNPYFELLVLVFLIVQIIRTFYLLHAHIIPCRMAATILRDNLHKLGIEKFYTYKTSFNDSFVETMIYNFPGEFEVEYIKQMSQIKSGFLVVPQTSAKSVAMETQREAIVNGDFMKDMELDQLIVSGQIEEIAVARIPTLGNSKYFAQESEVTSYLDLMLKRISQLDFYRGNAWIVEIE